MYEGTSDTDSDGIPEIDDPDSDDDGIPDGAERGNDGSTRAADTDRDRVPDFLDPDSDGDGIDDVDEGTGDSDSDGIPDALDPDGDGDGVPDADEGADDPDSDGIPNYLDPDADGDGIDDAEEGTGDSDSDGTPDSLESDTADSDSDGIPDAADPKETRLGASYCTNSPNYDCYKGGWPSCCRRPGSCPESKPECEEVSNVKPTQPGCALFASGEFAEKVAVRQCSKVELGPGDKCGDFAMRSKQCSDNGWPPPTHPHYAPSPLPASDCRPVAKRYVSCVKMRGKAKVDCMAKGCALV